MRLQILFMILLIQSLILEIRADNNSNNSNLNNNYKKNNNQKNNSNNNNNSHDDNNDVSITAVGVSTTAIGGDIAIAQSTATAISDDGSAIAVATATAIAGVNGISGDGPNNKPIVVSDGDICGLYTQWLLKRKRCYLNDDESIYRKQIFINNYRKILAHNNDPKNTYSLALNDFADMEEEEFNARYLTPNILQEQDLDIDNDTCEDEGVRNDYLSAADSNVCALQPATSINPALNAAFLFLPPLSWDWRLYNAVTPVKNQGSCGSCWAFSVVAVAEGVNRLRGNPLVRFSEQQLVDCCGVKGYGCQGCNGAWPIWAVNYAKQYGIVRDYQYPYVGYQTSCKVNSPTTGFYFKNRYYVFPLTFFLKIAIRQQPISVCVDASHWYLYSSGVFGNCSSAKTAANHAVTAVGFTIQGRWILKNSWGTGWGQGGYIITFGGNTCGVLNYALRAY